MGRPPCCDKSNVKKGPWTPEEDAKVLAYVANHGIGNWTLVPEKAGLNRCGKSCRLRWTNYLRPDLKHDAFTPREEEYILKLHKAIGSRWSLIAKHLPGRTDNDVKNHWNTKLRKKLLKMGIDPVTHKPFSQILTDFGNISGFPNTRNHFEPINNFMSNNSLLKPEQSSATPEIPIPIMLNRPTTEQFEDNPFSNKFSWDSAPHFQVPNQETIQPHLFNDVSYSTSSSSSCNLGTQLSSPQSFPCQASQFQTILPSSPSSWSDYLLGDPSLPTNVEKQQLQERKFQGVISSSCPSLSTQNETPGYNNCSEATSLAADSFVNSILNRDSEMQSEFPELFLDGYI